MTLSSSQLHLGHMACCALELPLATNAREQLFAIAVHDIGQSCTHGPIVVLQSPLVCFCPQVLGEIRPYLVGTGGGELLLDSIDGPIVKIKITGPAANVMTVRVAVTQKLRERIPAIAAVQLL